LTVACSASGVAAWAIQIQVRMERSSAAIGGCPWLRYATFRRSCMWIARRRPESARWPRDDRPDARGRNMGNDAAGVTILVINDTPEILDLFQDLLGEEGYRVIPDRFTVEAGEMLQRVRELEPDLIVLDYLIGEEGLGWQFLQMLKMDRNTREIPVIVCTGAARQVQEMESQLDKMGVAVVLKPFDIDHLLRVIDKVLEAPEEPKAPA
jgi:CheY-like chemotaxis protein